MPDVKTIPLLDSAISIQYEKNQVSMYILTPVAKEIQKKYPETCSIVRCNRRLAEMRIDLSVFSDKRLDSMQFKTDSTTTTFLLYQYHNKHDTSRYFLYLNAGYRAGLKKDLYLKMNDSTWMYATYNDNNFRFTASDSIIKLKLINSRPKRREFKTETGKYIFYYLSPTRSCIHFILRSRRLLKPEEAEIED